MPKMPKTKQDISEKDMVRRGGRGHARHRTGKDKHGVGHGHGRVFAPGDLRLMLLALLGDQARYGYELIKAIEEQFSGSYAPSPGSVYPTLTLLEDMRYLAGTPDKEGRRQYAVTTHGRAYLKENRTTLEGVRQRVRMVARAMAGERPPEAVHQAIHTLKTALSLHRGGWTDAEIKRVSAVIEHAARQIDEGRP
jgi:DNA-binding PadR family transcriptional regulator